MAPSAEVAPDSDGLTTADQEAGIIFLERDGVRRHVVLVALGIGDFDVRDPVALLGHLSLLAVPNMVSAVSLAAASAAARDLPGVWAIAPTTRGRLVPAPRSTELQPVLYCMVCMQKSSLAGATCVPGIGARRGAVPSCRRTTGQEEDQMRYEAPNSLDQAVALLAKETGEARVLAGGTDLLVQMRTDIIDPVLVVDIKGIAELRQIKEEGGGYRIGAAVTGAELKEHP